MSIRVEWFPSDEALIASYVLLSETPPAGSFTALTSITHDLTNNAVYDSTKGVFFYVDTAGLPTSQYKLVSVDTSANQSAPTAPFSPIAAAPLLGTTVRIDHNYPTPGNLRYQTPSSVPIEAATVLIYRKTDWDLGNTDKPLARTMTDASGNWVSPIFLTTGYSYTVELFKDSLYGPDVVTIVV